MANARLVAQIKARTHLGASRAENSAVDWQRKSPL